MDNQDSQDNDTGNTGNTGNETSRQKIFRVVDETVHEVLATVPRDARHLDCILIAQLICNLNDVFDTTVD